MMGTVLKAQAQYLHKCVLFFSMAQNTVYHVDQPIKHSYLMAHTTIGKQSILLDIFRNVKLQML